MDEDLSVTIKEESKEELVLGEFVSVPGMSEDLMLSIKQEPNDQLGTGELKLTKEFWNETLGTGEDLVKEEVKMEYWSNSDVEEDSKEWLHNSQVKKMPADIPHSVSTKDPGRYFPLTADLNEGTELPGSSHKKSGTNVPIRRNGIHLDNKLPTFLNEPSGKSSSVKEKMFICPNCPYKTPRKYHLKIHVRIHTGEKPFICSLCSYKSSRKGELVNHMRIHTGEKPFSCSICSYQASRKSSLIAHMKTHTGEKPFNCSLCSYAASRKSILRDHMRTHTGEKPYSCSLCSYKSSRKSHLTSHMKTHR